MGFGVGALATANGAMIGHMTGGPLGAVIGAGVGAAGYLAGRVSVNYGTDVLGSVMTIAG